MRVCGDCQLTTCLVDAACVGWITENYYVSAASSIVTSRFPSCLPLTHSGPRQSSTYVVMRLCFRSLLITHRAARP